MNRWRRTCRGAILICSVATVLVSASGCPTGQQASRDETSADRHADANVTAIGPSVEATESPNAGPSDDTASQGHLDGEGHGTKADSEANEKPEATAEQGSDTALEPDREPTGPEGRTAQSVARDAEAHGAENSSSDQTGRPCDGWPKPDLLLVFTGRQNGYIEPCGCSGFANATGGLTRRFTMIKELRDKGWSVLAVDVGNQVDRFGRQAELKFQTTIDVLKKMDYGAIGLGPDDLRLSFGELYAAIADVEEGDSPFVCANATLFDIPHPYRIVETGFGKVGVTAVLGTDEQTKVGTVDEIEFRDPAEALQSIVDNMKEEACDFKILLAHTSTDQSKALAEQFPEFNVVVTAGGAGEPPLEPDQIGESNTQLVQVGTKGMFVGLMGVYSDQGTPTRYERVELDDRFGDSREVLDAFASYQNTLKELGLEGLGLRPVRHPSGRTFVGSEACYDCHEIAYEIFENTPHFHATQSLAKPTERSEIPRHFDPECISCHMTGWNPQGYFPYESGYLDFEADSHLHSTGCESCHGPGSAHVAAEDGDSDVTKEEIEQLRQEMILTLEEAKTSKCYECHDLDNSPAFQEDGAFEEYWEQVKHEGKY